MVPRSVTINGVLVDSDQGIGLSGLSIEVWSLSADVLLPLDTGKSGEDGIVVLNVPIGADLDVENGVFRVEFRVFDSGELILAEIRTLSIRDGPQLVGISVPSSFASRSPDRIVIDSRPEPLEAHRQVFGLLDPGARDQAIVRPVSGDSVEQDTEESATETSVEEAGSSEYELLDQCLSRETKAEPAILDNPSEGAVFELADDISLEPETLALLKRAQALERDTGLPAPIFYALGRSGLSVELQDLIDVPISTLEATIAAAVNDEVVHKRILEEFEAVRARLAENILDRTIDTDKRPIAMGLGEIIACADLPKETVRDVLARYQARRGDVAEFWESLVLGDEERKAVDDSVRSSLELAVGLGALLGAEPPLVCRMLALRREGRWKELEDLAEFEFDDWCELIESIAPAAVGVMEAGHRPSDHAPEWASEASDGSEPEVDAQAQYAEAEYYGYWSRLDDEDDLAEDMHEDLGPSALTEHDLRSEDEQPDWVEIRAQAILDALEEAFPSAFIRRGLLREGKLGEGARGLLERVPKHDFLSDSIRERVTQSSNVLEGLELDETEAAVEEVEAIERISRVTHRAEEVLILLGTGLKSAHAIALQPRRQFIDAYGEALGGRAQASRVHAQAQQRVAPNVLAMVRLRQALQHLPLVLGGVDPELKQIPDAQKLFGSNGFCACEHCRSVLSPAAYFVDLLHSLDVGVARELKTNPLNALLARRPDLADIKLTCENTLTPLPYIDLVNELLEAHVTGHSAAAAHDTGSMLADVLKAVPQHIDRNAYEQLRQAVFPLGLPFHEPLAVARAYLAHLGVPRRRLLESFARGEGLSHALLAEALEMSPEELAIVSSTPQPLWRYLGFGAERSGDHPYLQVLAQAPVLLHALDISFQELIVLVSTRFINLGDQISLESPSLDDCGPENTRVTGLDEQRLSRMVRFLRLRKRLGWTLFDLDRALFALGARDLDRPILQQLVEIRDLSLRLNRPVVELLGLWAPLDTFGKDSEFKRLLQTRAVSWRITDQDTFKLKDNGLELAQTADSLDGVASALLAAFRMTSEELSLARTLFERLSGAPALLNLAGLSGIYRVVFLARALRLRIDQLDGMLRLVPAEANPLRPADPAATRRFVDLLHEVEASGFTPEQLMYLYRPTGPLRSDPGPRDAQVQLVLGSIRRGLIDAVTETARPRELTADFLRQKLSMWLDPPLVDPAMEVLDPRTRITAQTRQRFFNRHLATIFPDPGAAAASLFAASAPAAGALVAHRAALRPGETEAAGGQSATVTPASRTSPTNTAEDLWRVNIEQVVNHLLPRLRAKQIRGAIVLALSDALGTSNASTGRLLDGLLRSRRSAARPIIEDFAALLGTGLTGSYFTNRDLRGEPTVTRTDAVLDMSWGGASPAPGIPGDGFSVRWSGRLLPRSKAPHTFFVSTDGGIRLSIVVDGRDHVLLNEIGGKGAIVDYESETAPLDPAKLYDIKIEYRNTGRAASVSVRYGTSPDSKQTIPTADLFPLDGLASFDPVLLSYRRLHKAALLVMGLGINDDQLQWLTGQRYLDLDNLPVLSTETVDPIASFQRWRQLAALYGLSKRLPRSRIDLFATFKATNFTEAIALLIQATGWDKSVVEALVGGKGFAVDQAALGLPVEPAREPFLLRLERAVDIQRRAGVSPETLFTWASRTPNGDDAAAMVQAVKARYDEKQWLEVAERLNEPLRIRRRDALVAYLIPRLNEKRVTNRNELFEYLLIDVEMSPCMLTSRIRQAIGSVQTFYQRVLMNLEKSISPRTIDSESWKWMKNYRVWEANRKVFLYPENWIEPELRDDKTPEFKAFERSILQQEIKKENVESAFIDYLQSLDEVSRLDVRAVWFERREPRLPKARQPRERISRPGSRWESGTYHVFARTYNAPHTWFYRRLDKGRIWTPWEKIDAAIEGDHLIPVMFQNRMFLFWTIFQEKSKPTPPPKRNAEPKEVGKDWEIGLAYSVYDRGRWTRKQLSNRNVVDDDPNLVSVRRVVVDARPALVLVRGSANLPTSAYTLQATPRDGHGTLEVRLYRRAVDGHPRVASGPNLRLSRTNVELIARFQLQGCNGELALVTPERVTGSGRRSRIRLPVPPGYSIDGTSFRAEYSSGALLTMPAMAADIVPVLSRPRGDPRGIRILPVFDTAPQRTTGLFPFFFQDKHRTYFARPVANETPRIRRLGLPSVFQFGRRPAPVTHRKRAPRRRARAHGRQGETLEIAVDEAALDTELGLETAETTSGQESRQAEMEQWDDSEDEAWHPDDAEALRPPRRDTRSPKRGAPAPAHAPLRKPAHAPVRTPAHAPVRTIGRRANLERLRFIPFEHSQTCRLISTLRSDGIDALLALETSQRVGIDHFYKNGVWSPNIPSYFEREYRPGMVVDPLPPRSDIDFEYDNPYSLYNWELFFHAPLLVATRLTKDGRHEEAQRWLHFLFNPTIDTGAPIPRRYWRFAPFYENTEYQDARRMMALLSYNGPNPVLIERQQRIAEQVKSWTEKPFNPHIIARLRIAAYQKTVVMKYIDNILEWGDKLFRQDTMESVQEATQLYILAQNMLGPRLEQIPPPVEPVSMTFGQVRGILDKWFANWQVRLENSQVRRPFRGDARPDFGGVTAVLNMASLYFCIPPNLELDKKWDAVEDRLFKIRHCMNIAGVVRQLPLFEPPIDPAILVRAAAAGVDLSSVISSLNAPPPIHRFRALVQRAIALADQVRSFGAAMLNALERRDAEHLAALRQSNEGALFEAIRDVHKTKVKQVEEELAGLGLQREHVDLQAQHALAQTQQPMIAQETAKHESLNAAKLITGAAEAIDIAAKVAYAIPDFQLGTAGGFSSPFVTAQLGGQSAGAVLTALAQSMFKVMGKHQIEADMSGAQAEYQQRKAEQLHRHALLTKERERIQKRIGETQVKLEIVNAELKRHDMMVENARKVTEYMREKYTSEELYSWMTGQLSAAYFQIYKLAFDMAKLAERALQFERGDPATTYVEFSYWDSLRKGLLAGERLLIDIRRMEAAHLDGDRRALEVTRHVSMKEDAPTALEELLATGRCRLDLGETLFDGDFPGHYFRRLKTVSMTIAGPSKPSANVNCTLTLLESRIRTSANAGGSYPQTQDGDDPRFLMNPVPVQAIAVSRPHADPGMFVLNFDDERYLHFEGAGLVSSWRIDLHQSDNTANLSELEDVVLSLSYTARSGGAPLEAVARANRETAFARGGMAPPLQHRVSVRRDLSEFWSQLRTLGTGQTAEVKVPLEQARLPGRYLGLKLAVEGVSIYAQSRHRLADDVLRLQIGPPTGTAEPVGAWMRPWPSSQTLRAELGVRGPAGHWKLTAGAREATIPDLLVDLVLVFELRGQKETG